MPWIAADGIGMSGSPDELADKGLAAVMTSACGEPFDQEMVVDTITNIFHLIEREGMNRRSILSMAIGHWEQEKDGEEE